MEEIILKPSFVRQGLDIQVDPQVTAKDTIQNFKSVLPENLGGIAFISGGIKDSEAIETLKLLNKYKDDFNFTVLSSYSFGRALQTRCLQSWKGSVLNLNSAQKKLIEVLSFFK